jgi:small subunit ribosomal protein S18
VSPRSRDRRAPELDYKDLDALRRVTSRQGKLHGRRRAGTDATSQRRAKLAVKRARFLALLPYVGGD